MPRRDKTGPAGMGPMTGRGMGCCTGYMAPTMENSRGFGRGRRLNRCYPAGMYGWRRYAEAGTYGPDEKEILKDRIDFLEEQLQRTKARLENMEEDREAE